jgi:branched-chain amino acid transport system permease protein
VLLAVCAVVSLLVERSRAGLVLQAIKQNEMAAQAAGINPLLWKTITLMLSGALAAAAGGLYVTVLLVATPREVFGVFVSASALIFAMFGGIGSVWGPLIGAAILVPLGEVLHAELGHLIPGLQGIVYGAAIVIVTRLMPEGIFWRLRDRFLARKAATAPVELPQDGIELRSEPAALKLDGVSKSFGAVRAAQNVTLDIARGSITGVVGPNGAGKTTVFNIVNGFVTPDSGTIYIDDQKIDQMPAYKRAMAGLGRTFQVARVFERMSVGDNLVAAAVAKGKSIAEARALAARAARIVGLDTVFGRPASSLSAFQVRLIEIGRAIAGSPRVLLLDETLAGLSASEADEVVKVLRRVRDLGVTLVIIEHTMSVMAALVERMIVLDHGTVIADGPPADVLRDRQVITAYLGQKWANRA